MRARIVVRWILILAAIPFLLFLGAAVAGSRLPEEHVVANVSIYEESLERVWDVVSDVEDYPAWREGVNEVEELPERNGNPVYREIGTRGSLTYEVVELSPPQRLSVRIADPDLPFGGTWTWTLEPRGSGVAVTLVERAQISHPVFRFMARHLIGHHSGIDVFQRDLARELAETVSPTHIDPPDGH